ncbi:MAG: hypothetical protein HY773_02270 [Candidatus Terrybacteria bacterium]|nr:hypothetical protein [Candidatus Terrybacteria bacterium]
MKMVKKIIPLGLAFAPFLALGADAIGVIGTIKGVLNAVVPLLIGVAVVVFLYGVIKYITSGGDPEKRTEARNVMIYGIIGLFVMVAVWGLVNVLISTFGLGGGPVQGPSLP